MATQEREANSGKKQKKAVPKVIKSNDQDSSTNKPNESETQKNASKWKLKLAEWREVEIHNRAMVYLTGTIAFFTLIVAGFNAYQISIYWKAVRVENRAYITSEQINSRVQPIVGKKAIIDAAFQNAGKTPAYNVRHAAIVKIGTGVYQADIDTVEHMMGRSPGVVGAGRSFSYDMDFRECTREDSISISTGVRFYLVIGRVTYEDRFGHHHFTHYSYRLDMTARNGMWRDEGNYNDAD